VLVLIGLLACRAVDTSTLLATYTPQAGPTATPAITVESSPSATAAQIAPTPAEPATPTSICINAQTCLIPTAEATAEGAAPLYEFIQVVSGKVRCVALSDLGLPIPCRVRQQPTLQSASRLVPYGTEFDVTSIYHCEFYARCDDQIVEWYFTTTHEWAAVLESVWQLIPLIP
jgi:hypothetical protein